VIPGLLEEAARRATAADVIAKRDDTLVLEWRNGQVVRAEAFAEAGTALRVLVDGRVGHAGTNDDVERLVERAVASARTGPLVPLLQPAPSPLPAVLTATPRAAAAGVTALAALGAGVAARLARAGRDVTLRVERSCGDVRVANARGVDAAYDMTLVHLAVEVTRHADGLVAAAELSGVDVPEESDLDALVADVERQLDRAALAAELPADGVPVVLLPRAVRAFLAPVLEGLLGRHVYAGHSPFAEAVDEPMLDRALTLRDDPWLEGRPGSRPIDDESVPTWPRTLVDAGVVAGFATDLETAALVGRPATGQARWRTYGKPQAAFGNLLLAPGEASLERLLAQAGEALLVDRLGGVAGVPRSGAFGMPVALGYRVERGEVTGVVRGGLLSGNVFEALNAVGGVGLEREWVGDAFLPALLVGDVTVSPA
jgi:PmbA protein